MREKIWTVGNFENKAKQKICIYMELLKLDEGLPWWCSG